jgi:hypothetical protein
MKPQVTQVNRKSHRPDQEKSQPQEHEQHGLTGFGLSCGSAPEIFVSHDALPLVVPENCSIHNPPVGGRVQVESRPTQAK